MKDYLKILRNYWNVQTWRNPIPEFSFICPFLMVSENQAYFYNRMPKKLILKSFQEDFKEIEELLIYNQENQELNEQQKRVLTFQINKFKHKGLEILDHQSFIKAWEYKKALRERFGKEKYDKVIYNKYNPKTKI